ncbi:Protein FAR1-RELATED SEQUENCE 5 [Bienertia sinuspersici]
MLARERNGLQEIAINERDIRNELYREKKLKLKDGDAKVMLEYFEKMTEGNQFFFFFHTYRLDNFGQMQDILWKHGKCKGYNEFKDELLNAIYDSLSVPEFESLFGESEMWVPAYKKHLFWIGMKTTQRVESIHSFDDYMNKHTTLAEFTEMYCRAMEKRVETERQYDAHSKTFIW